MVPLSAPASLHLRCYPYLHLRDVVRYSTPVGRHMSLYSVTVRCVLVGSYLQLGIFSAAKLAGIFIEVWWPLVHCVSSPHTFASRAVLVHRG